MNQINQKGSKGHVQEWFIDVMLSHWSSLQSFSGLWWNICQGRRGLAQSRKAFALSQQANEDDLPFNGKSTVVCRTVTTRSSFGSVIVGVVVETQFGYHLGPAREFEHFISTKIVPVVKSNMLYLPFWRIFHAIKLLLPVAQQAHSLLTRTNGRSQTRVVASQLRLA